MNCHSLILVVAILCEITLIDAFECSQTYNTDNDGVDEPKCLNGSTNCFSLVYVLTALKSKSFFPRGNTICVSVYNSQSVEDIDKTIMMDLHSSAFYIYGKNNTVLNFDGNELHLRRIAVFWLQDLTIMNLKILNGTRIFMFQTTRCTFRDIGTISLTKAKVLLSSTTFIGNSKIPGIRNLISISQGNKMKVVECIFSHNDRDYPLIHRTNYGETGTIHTVQFKSCRFENNTASLMNFERDETQLNQRPFKLFITNCTFINNTSNNHFLIHVDLDIGVHIFILFGRSNKIILQIKNSTFANNALNYRGDSQSPAILSIEQPLKPVRLRYLLHNVIFNNNIRGTPLRLKNLNASLSGYMLFTNNIGIYGGALLIDATNLTITGNVSFHNNKAHYGGAVYYSSLLNCPLYNNTGTVKFIKNHALTLGDNVFVYNPVCGNKRYFSESISDGYVTGPYTIKLDQQIVSIFSGQHLSYSVKVYDINGNPSSCMSRIVLFCESCSQKELRSIKLIGVTETVISHNTNKTLNLSIGIEDNRHRYPSNLGLKLVCFETGINSRFNLVLKDCPLGYEFQYASNTTKSITSVKGTCKCIEIQGVQCDPAIGVACIKSGYWFGIINNIADTNQCQYTYCRRDLLSCPIQGLHDTYFELPSQQDDQCNGLNGGLLCRGCREGAVFTFEAIKCIPVSQCHEWHPYIVILCAIAFQLLLSFLIIASLKTRYKTGIGHVYGPVFFLSLMKILPFSSDKSLYNLKIVLSLFQSIALLNLEVIGEIPWCFFQECNKILNYSLHFLGPLIVFCVLMLTIQLTRWLPRVFSFLQSSPIQSISLLIFLSFWSVSDTCIQLLKPITVHGGWRSSVQPGIKYLDNIYHIFGFIVSLFLLFVLLIPMIILLLFSPILRRKINLTKIQPLLDAVQSCYKENLRWYSGIYLTASVVLSVQPPYLAIKLIVFFIGALHFIIQPYQSKWLNVIDSILLLDVCLLTSLLSEDTLQTEEGIVSIFVLVIVPLIYITFGLFFIVCQLIGSSLFDKFKICFGNSGNRRGNDIDDSDEELIDILDNDSESSDSSDSSNDDEQEERCHERKRESMIFDTQ